jgi:Leucine-rich repeat (LRR) protein
VERTENDATRLRGRARFFHGTVRIHSKVESSVRSLEQCSWLSALKELDLRYDDNLATLPSLPGSLEKFNLSNTKLKTLPSLEGLSALKELDLSSNPQLTTLPPLPGSLEKLDLSHDNLTTLPSLEGLSALKDLDLSLNPQLTSLPSLPGSLQTLNLFGTNVNKNHQSLQGPRARGVKITW